MLQIDVWSDAKSHDAAKEGIPSIKSGIHAMKQLKKEGHGSIRMYVRDSEGDTSKNRYYYFENNKIKFDIDDY